MSDDTQKGGWVSVVAWVCLLGMCMLVPLSLQFIFGVNLNTHAAKDPSINRWALYASVLISIGGAAMIWWLAIAHRRRRWAPSRWTAAALSALLTLIWMSPL